MGKRMYTQDTLEARFVVRKPSHPIVAQKFACGVTSGRIGSVDSPSRSPPSGEEGGMKTVRFLVLVALMMGCGDATGPEAAIAGRYELESVNGESLPIISAFNNRVLVSSGFILLRDDATYSFHEAGELHSDDGNGTFRRDGEELLTFTSLVGDTPGGSGEVWRANILGERLLLIERVYLKQNDSG